MSMCNLHFFKDISFNVWRKARSPPIWAISVHGAQKPLYYVLTFYENNLEITFFSWSFDTAQHKYFQALSFKEASMCAIYFGLLISSMYKDKVYHPLPHAIS